MSLRAKVDFTHTKAKGGFDLACISFKEKKLHVIYSPSLDLYGYGKTEEQAKESFHITLDEFIRYTLNKNTLFKELRRLGWKVKGSAKNAKATPPNFEELLRDNEHLADIVIKKKHYTRYSEPVNIPQLQKA